MQNFLKNIKIDRVSAAAAAAQTAINSDIVDMVGFDGCIFIAVLDEVTVNSVLTLTVEQNTVNSATGMASIGATAAHTATATDADSKLLVVDVCQPLERYLRAVLTRTAADAVVGSILAFQYRASELPVTQSADVLVSTLLIAAAQV